MVGFEWRKKSSMREKNRRGQAKRRVREGAKVGLSATLSGFEGGAKPVQCTEALEHPYTQALQATG